ncbi:Coatomer subunit gamma-like protein 2, partial [Rozella allomycis CSF55]
MRKKDEDNAGGIEEYFALDKSTILQECRVFNETPIRARRCSMILTKLIALMLSGQPISSVEATDAFFSVTKLFQSNDNSLRRLVYIAIKELSRLSENVIMVTSSLMKDMNSRGEVMYKSNAIRALSKISDASMMQSVERYYKQAIVDRSGGVASASLVSAYH